MINLQKHLPLTKVLVVGDVMLDSYYMGDVTRISPEAPVPIVKIDRVENKPGGAANVALNIAALGATVHLMGVVGADSAADDLGDLLRTWGRKVPLTHEFIETNAHPTISKVRVLSGNHQMIRLDFEVPLLTFDRQRLKDRISNLVASYDVVVFSDYNKGTLVDVQDLITLCVQAGVKTIVDPKGHDFTKYAKANIVTPNLQEFQNIVGVCVDEGDMKAKGVALCEKLKLDAIVLTRAADGITLIERSGDCNTFASAAVEVADVTGAGDTVAAVFAAFLNTPTALSDICILSNIAASLVIAKVGTSHVYFEDIQQAFHKLYAHNLTESSLSDVLKALKKNGKKIVMTNGCFDLLHIGHVRYLQEAKALGDVLVVAINGDASVKRLKGNSRPINRCADRMDVVRSLDCVDYVIELSDDDPTLLIQQLAPDILCKGGDYTEDKILGADLVKSYGGTVKTLPYHEGYSSSNVVGRFHSASDSLP